MPKKIEISDGVAGKCTCGATFTVSLEHTAVFHPLPTCDEYVRLEPLEYLEHCRKAREN